MINSNSTVSMNPSDRLNAIFAKKDALLLTPDTKQRSDSLRELHTELLSLKEMFRPDSTAQAAYTNLCHLFESAMAPSSSSATEVPFTFIRLMPHKPEKEPMRLRKSKCTKEMS